MCVILPCHQSIYKKYLHLCKRHTCFNSFLVYVAYVAFIHCQWRYKWDITTIIFNICMVVVNKMISGLVTWLYCTHFYNQIESFDVWTCRSRHVGFFNISKWLYMFHDNKNITVYYSPMVFSGMCEYSWLRSEIELHHCVMIYVDGWCGINVGLAKIGSWLFAKLGIGICRL